MSERRFLTRAYRGQGKHERLRKGKVHAEVPERWGYLCGGLRGSRDQEVTDGVTCKKCLRKMA